MCIRDRIKSNRTDSMRTFIAIFLVSAFVCIAYGQQPTWKRFNQCDSEWRNDPIGRKTVCNGGSQTTCLAMILVANGMKCNNEECNPRALNNWLKRNQGYRGSTLVWSSIKNLGLLYEGYNKDLNTIKRETAGGRFAILRLKGFNKWAVAIEKTDQGWKIMNPAPEAKGGIEIIPDSDVTGAALFSKTQNEKKTLVEALLI
eukprot:TRINITY_DN10008_c0_g1_i2.p1 TRINITY_DN10008_c0_g1~~TRINITY_DN10008_c0_g1_i2.p1  ORF type:complete len:232 (-),score=66.46 TRINITY_DN10008_c0_g1_i2:178-780(-)